MQWQPLLLSVLACSLTARQALPIPQVVDEAAGGGPGFESVGGMMLSPLDLVDIIDPGQRTPARGYEFPYDELKSFEAPRGFAPPAGEDGASFLAPPLALNFSGIGDTGSFPPDPVIAAGPNHIIQAVNRSFRISTKQGATISTTSFATWWSPVISGVSPFDPWVVYDHFNSRWVLMTAAINCTTNQAWYLMATSWTSDPTGGWCLWALRSDLDGGTDTNNWADYPKLGLDATSFFITSNQFRCSDNAYQYSKIRVMNKSQFYNNSCGGIGWWDFLPSGSDFSMQPCLTYGFPSKEYIVNSESGSGSTLTVRSVSGTWPSGAAPVLTTEGTVSVGSYSAPSDALQSGSATRIDTGDARLLNAVYRNGSVVTGHSIDWASGAESRIQVVQFSASTLTTSFNTSYGATGSYYFCPAVTADPTGNIYTVFSRSGASEFAGARFTVKLTTDASFQGSASLKPGEASYVEIDSVGRNRWGDYAGIALDPVDTSFCWIYNEYAESPSNSWGTWVGQIGYGPLNDQCANAIAVGTGTFFGNLDGASNDGTAVCGASSSSPDVWYTHTATCTGTLTVSTCGTHDGPGLDLGVDTVLSLRTSCAGVELACNDDDNAVIACSGLDTGLLRDSAVQIPVTLGQLVYIRVANFNNGPTGPFTLRVSCQPPPPSNDNCANAIVVGNGVFGGTLAGATNDGSAVCGSSTTSPDVWYAYTSSCTGTLLVSTCGTHDGPGLDQGIDTVLSLHSACGGTELACNDDDNSVIACAGLDSGILRDSAVSIPVTAGQSVRIRVANFFNGATGPFTLRVSCSPSGPSAYCAPANPNSVSAGGALLTSTSGYGTAFASFHLAQVPNQPGILYAGPSQINLPFGCGRRCVGGTVVRYGVLVPSGNQANTTVNMSAPGLANIQFWFRDPAYFATCGNAYNLSNALHQ